MRKIKISSSFVAYEKKKWVWVLPIVNGGINAGLHYLPFHCVGVEMVICAVGTSVLGIFLGICLRGKK